METRKIQLIFFLLGTFLFNWLFWQEQFGLNLLIFNVFILLSSYFIYPNSFKSKYVIAFSILCILTATFVFLYGSTIAKITNCFLLLICIGYIHQPKLKAAFYAGFTSIINFFKLPLRKVFNNNSNNKKQNSISKIISILKIVVIPILFLSLFIWIYKIANPIFNDLTIQFWLPIKKFFFTISWGRLMFILLGTIIIASFIFHNNIIKFIHSEEKLRDFIIRKRRIKATNSPIYNYKHTLSLNLKNEYRSAVFLILSVNLLLLIVNATDVNWIWFNFEYDGSFNLSQFVHEGTYLLIVSVLLSMGIILYFFRKNINFISKNKLLKQLSILWIAQNIILVISVGIRNYHYIDYYGLAYKRIGVIFFLIATIVGLITLYIKITQLKSAFYLLKVNSLNIISVLVLLSSFNWDIIIAQYNIKNISSENMDVHFLLSLSDKILPLIEENKHLLSQESDFFSNSIYEYNEEYLYEDKLFNFLETQEKLSWLSMNLSTQKAINYYKTKAASQPTLSTPLPNRQIEN
ncbi:MAG: DUF4173 domain-containing protein [Flavobacteriales bacterium]|nr:DUF4173 domain-containing protein [Flavobacteriales bacterium]MCW8913133.1 DUF4173 domain-containing protein [Flavobacteriales bacterium]MCW8937786.1 DUF4173 domain-containing protein [Flavobacteriales bacterium]MCW8940036.1 DUF4173 domain-containing protein [Flavobacteriales bacterium]MCW8967402.1 DUF4173 domain-containing protein [Flavobacteriales bacterium]